MILMLVAAFLLGMFFKKMMGSVCSTVEGNGGDNLTSDGCINDTLNLINTIQGMDAGSCNEGSDRLNKCRQVWQNAHSQYTVNGPCGSVREELARDVDPLFNTNGKCVRCNTENWE